MNMYPTPPDKPASDLGLLDWLRQEIVAGVEFLPSADMATLSAMDIELVGGTVVTAADLADPDSFQQIHMRFTDRLPDMIAIESLARRYYESLEWPHEAVRPTPQGCAFMWVITETESGKTFTLTCNLLSKGREVLITVT